MNRVTCVLSNKSLMADFIEFTDYLLAEVQKSVREDSPAKDWALARAKVLKQLRGLGDRRGAWIKQFIESVQFSGDEDSFVEFIIGYVLTADVRLNLESSLSEQANTGAKGLGMDPTMKSLLEEQQKLISTLADQVNSLTLAPARSAVQIPHLSTKSLWQVSIAYNHREWVNWMLRCLGSFVLRRPLQNLSMRIFEKLCNEDQKGLPVSLSDSQKSDHTICTELKKSGSHVSMPDAALPEAIPPPPPSVNTAEVSPTVILLVEALWTLTYTGVIKYKEKNESDTTTSKQASNTAVFTEGLTPAGAHIKKVMAKRFKMVDGEEHFEVHRGEWIKTSSPPVSPYKTCRGKAQIERHWVWQCPMLE